VVTRGGAQPLVVGGLRNVYFVRMIADATQWRLADEAMARRQAAEIATQVGAASVTVREHEFAGRRGWIALFDIADSTFAFVPGGEVTIGYDPNRFTPMAEQAADYADTARDFDLPPIREHISAMTSPARTVTVPPLLVAINAIPGDEWLYEEAIERLADGRQRLLTPDEWEHACGAGVTTLFRWGDGCPVDTDPWSARTGPHRVPNAFGLNIAQDPYDPEWTADPSVVCGGDGGSMVCGERALSCPG
jgi:hypothetical protein